MTDILCMITGIFIGAAITVIARLNFTPPQFMRKRDVKEAYDSEEEKKMSEMIRQYNNILNYTGGEATEE